MFVKECIFMACAALKGKLLCRFMDNMQHKIKKCSLIHNIYFIVDVPPTKTKKQVCMWNYSYIMRRKNYHQKNAL